MTAVPGDPVAPAVEPAAPLSGIDICKLVLLGIDSEVDTLLVLGTAIKASAVNVFLELPTDARNLTNQRQGRPGDQAHWVTGDEQAYGVDAGGADRGVWCAWWDLSIYPDLQRIARQLRDSPGSVELGVAAEADDGSRVTVAQTFRAATHHYAQAFDLGVLLIHGIGGARRGETLVRFSEPIIDFMRNLLARLSASEHYRIAATAGEEAQWKEVYENLPARPFDQLVGLTVAVAQSQGIRPLANFDADDAVIDPDQKSQSHPAACPMKFSCFVPRVDDQGQLIRDHRSRPQGRYDRTSILLAESCWTNTVIAPGVFELCQWIFAVGPVMFASMIGMSFQRIQRRLREAKASSGLATPAGIGFLVQAWFRLLWSWLVIVPIGTIVTLALSLLIAAVMVIAVIPSAGLRARVAGVIQTLLGTTGLSYVFVHSRIRRSAILGQVARDFDWLQQRCKKMIVLAHSQGGAVAHELLASRIPPTNLREFIPFGSGLKPLGLIDPERNRDLIQHQQTTRAWFVILVGSLTLGLLWLARGLASTPGPDAFDFAGVLWICPACSLAIYWLAGVERMPDLAWRNALKQRFIYASHDPVPNGPIERKTPVENDRFSTVEVDNYASFAFDHNSYFSNQEQFVAPIAIELMAQSRIPLSQVFPDDFPAADVPGKSVSPPWLDAAGKRRSQIVRSTARIKLVLDALLLAAAIGCTVLFAVPLGGRALRMMGGVLARLADSSSGASPDPRTLAGLLGTATVCFLPVIILLAWRLFEGELILRWQLAASAELLLARTTDAEVPSWLGLRLAALALVLGTLAWWSVVIPPTGRWRSMLELITSSPEIDWAVAVIAVANSVLLGQMVRGARSRG